jgi:hypothetical protein
MRLTLAGMILFAAGCGGSGTKSSNPPPPPPPPPPAPVPPASVTFPGGTVKLVAPGHEMRVNAKWRYRVELTNKSGKKLRGRITILVVDPLGRAHPAAYDNTKQNIVDRPFSGVFRDYLEFPPDSRGFTLTVRTIVKAGQGKATLDYHVTPK